MCHAILEGRKKSAGLTQEHGETALAEEDDLVSLSSAQFVLGLCVQIPNLDGLHETCVGIFAGVEM